jgi:hypothetical protein
MEYTGQKAKYRAEDATRNVCLLKVQCTPVIKFVSELPLNSWSRETFEVYYFRRKVKQHEESAKDLHHRVEARSGAIGTDERQANRASG